MERFAPSAVDLCSCRSPLWNLNPSADHTCCPPWIRHPHFYLQWRGSKRHKLSKCLEQIIANGIVTAVLIFLPRSRFGILGDCWWYVVGGNLDGTLIVGPHDENPTSQAVALTFLTYYGVRQDLSITCHISAVGVFGQVPLQTDRSTLSD